MAFRSGVVRLAAVLILAGCAHLFEPSTGLEPDDLGSILCCHCPTTNSRVACGNEVDDLFAQWVGEAEELGLTRDAACEERTITEAGLREYCPSDVFDGLLPCLNDCGIFFGEAAEGETCKLIGRRFSTCAQGLACGADGVCHLPCELPLEIPEGGPCTYARGVLAGTCATATVCGPDGFCIPAAMDGETCGAGIDCQAGSYCGESEVCIPGKDEGEECSDGAECVSGYCDGYCELPSPNGCPAVNW